MAIKIANGGISGCPQRLLIDPCTCRCAGEQIILRRTEIIVLAMRLPDSFPTRTLETPHGVLRYRPHAGTPFRQLSTEPESYGKTHAKNPLEPFIPAHADHDDADGNARQFKSGNAGVSGCAASPQTHLSETHTDIGCPPAHWRRHRCGGRAALSALQAARRAAHGAHAARGDAARLPAGRRSTSREQPDEPDRRSRALSRTLPDRKSVV